MIYCISDLHGRYDLYMKMLKKISFSEKDTLYILGDVVDRGSEGLKILLDIAERDNVKGIMGNHDFVALTVLLNTDNSGLLLDEQKRLALVWRQDGGDETYKEYKALSPLDRAVALVTLDGFAHYAELTVGEREFVLCHGGIAGYTPEKPLSEYDLGQLAFEREDYTKAKFGVENKYLVTGHTPTVAIEGAEQGRIYRNQDHIAIDCGAVFGFGLGCICLDTLEEFYVI